MVPAGRGIIQRLRMSKYWLVIVSRKGTSRLFILTAISIGRFLRSENLQLNSWYNEVFKSYRNFADCQNFDWDKESVTVVWESWHYHFDSSGDCDDVKWRVNRLSSKHVIIGSCWLRTVKFNVRLPQPVNSTQKSTDINLIKGCTVIGHFVAARIWWCWWHVAVVVGRFRKYRVSRSFTAAFLRRNGGRPADAGDNLTPIRDGAGYSCRGTVAQILATTAASCWGRLSRWTMAVTHYGRIVDINCQLD